MITVHVPAMTARQDVRAISASISDVPGVQTLQADLATHTVQVTGPLSPRRSPRPSPPPASLSHRPLTAPRLQELPEQEDVP